MASCVVRSQEKIHAAPPARTFEAHRPPAFHPSLPGRRGHHENDQDEHTLDHLCDVRGNAQIGPPLDLRRPDVHHTQENRRDRHAERVQPSEQATAIAT